MNGINSPINVGGLEATGSTIVPESNVRLGERIRAAGERFADIGQQLRQQDDQLTQIEVLDRARAHYDSTAATVEEHLNSDAPDWMTRAEVAARENLAVNDKLLSSAKFNNPALRASVEATLRNEATDFANRTAGRIRARRSAIVVSSAAQAVAGPDWDAANPEHVANTAGKIQAVLGAVNSEHRDTVSASLFSAMHKRMADALDTEFLDFTLDRTNIPAAAFRKALSDRLDYYAANEATYGKAPVEMYQRKVAAFEQWASARGQKADEAKTSAFISNLSKGTDFGAQGLAVAGPTPVNEEQKTLLARHAEGLKATMASFATGNPSLLNDYINSEAMRALPDSQRLQLISAFHELPGKLRSHLSKQLKDKGMDAVADIDNILSNISASESSWRTGGAFRNRLMEEKAKFGISSDADPDKLKDFYVAQFVRFGLSEEEAVKGLVDKSVISAFEVGSSEEQTVSAGRVGKFEFRAMSPGARSRVAAAHLNMGGGTYPLPPDDAPVHTGVRDKVEEAMLASHTEPLTVFLLSEYGGEGAKAAATAATYKWMLANPNKVPKDSDEARRFAEDIVRSLPVAGANSASYDKHGSFESFLFVEDHRTNAGNRANYAKAAMFDSDGPLGRLLNNKHNKMLFANPLAGKTAEETMALYRDNPDATRIAARLHRDGTLRFVVERRLIGPSGSDFTDTWAPFKDNNGKPVSLTPAQYSVMQTFAANLENSKQHEDARRITRLSATHSGRVCTDDIVVARLVFGAFRRIIHKGDQEVLLMMGRPVIERSGQRAGHTSAGKTIPSDLLTLSIQQRKMFVDEIARFAPPVGSSSESSRESLVSAYLENMGLPRVPSVDDPGSDARALMHEQALRILMAADVGAYVENDPQNPVNQRRPTGTPGSVVGLGVFH